MRFISSPIFFLTLLSYSNYLTILSMSSSYWFWTYTGSSSSNWLPYLCE